MFGFHKPKMYRSNDGCCICRAKSSSSRFTDSGRYERDFRSCFGLGEVRCGDICNACVLLVKRWKKLPAGSKKNWNHVVDAKGSSTLKTTVKTQRTKSRPSRVRRVHGHLKRHNSDAHSTTSSASPAQSPSYSNPSDEGSDAELSPGAAHSPALTFLDLTYWKRQRVCCGIIYKGRFGEVIIDPHLYKPCCPKKEALRPDGEVEDIEEEEEEEEEAAQGDGEGVIQPPLVEQRVEVEEEGGGERW